MVEEGRFLEEILVKFRPKREIVKGKNGDEVAYRVSRDLNRVSQDPNGLILYATPETKWLERGEQQESQTTA